jgi:DNA-directed RNA polymerase specialized sigma24 family protein
MSISLHRRLRRILEGDPDSAAWLYDTFAPGLYHRLQLRYRHLREAEPADLLHDTFVFFLRPDTRPLAQLLEETSPETLAPEILEQRLWDLACGLASNRRRSAWSRRVVPLPEVRQTSPQQGAEAQLAARDALAKLDRCLEGESEEGYLYYQLRYVDGLKPREIAAATGRAIEEIYRLRQVLDGAVRRCAERLGLGKP